MKKCIKCKKIKDLSNYHRHKNMKDGHINKCKLCVKLYKKEYYIKEKDGVIQAYKDENKEKLIKKRKKYRQENLDILRAKSNEWKAQNKEKVKKYNKVYLQKTIKSGKKKEYDKKYREDNREKLNKRSRKYRNKGSNKVNFRIRSLLRRWISKQYEGSSRYLNYTLSELKQHLESQFKPGMSWDNIDQWHIDHIIPLKYKNSDGLYYWNQKELADPTSETFKKAWSLNNLQPLWAEENLSKRNKYIG